MANSYIPGPTGTDSLLVLPARTPGPLGHNDAGDPDVTTQLGDTPGPVGLNDHGDPSLPTATASGQQDIARLPNGTVVSPGADGKMKTLICPAPLTKRADGAKIDVDWGFISDREGGQVLTGYVPNASGSQSGVTIGTGVDLGQRSDVDKYLCKINLTIKKSLRCKIFQY